jgi:hypothetical protein
MMSRTGSSPLYRLIAGTPADAARPGDAVGAGDAGTPGDGTAERCQLCADPIADGHRHVLDTEARTLRCACRACAVLFDRATAGGRHYRLVPDRRWYLPDFVLDDESWARLRLPVDLAFFFYDTRAGRVAAFYPSPAGAVESLLELDSWARLVRANPVLDTLQPDTEALLVDRSRGARRHWLVPIDDCYALVGLIRTHWSGLSGGERVWSETAAFLQRLQDRARTVRASRHRPAPGAAALVTAAPVTAKPLTAASTAESVTAESTAESVTAKGALR